MQSIFTMLRAGFSPLGRAALLLIAAGAFGACDRHSAAEVRPNYGHGSSHERDTLDHQADSSGARHFSDSVGAKDEEGADPHAKPAASPTPTPAGRVL